MFSDPWLWLCKKNTLRFDIKLENFSSTDKTIRLWECEQWWRGSNVECCRPALLQSTRSGSSENFSVAGQVTPWHVTHNYYGNVQAGLPTEARGNYNNVAITLSNPSLSQPPLSGCHYHRLKLINPQSDSWYSPEVNLLDRAAKQSTAPLTAGLDSFYTRRSFVRCSQCSPFAAPTYSEHDLICFSS